MSNNVYHISLNDVYSGDSDFEIINNSDSEEIELNCCYQKLNNDKDYCDCSCNFNGEIINNDDDDDDDDDDDEILVTTTKQKSIETATKSSPPSTELINFDKNSKYFNNSQKNNKSEKLILGLKQDQILCVEQNRQHQQQQQQQNKKYLQKNSSNNNDKNKNENDSFRRTRSGTFTIPFTIVPIDISKNNENRCKTEKTNLPEIVLTSFENSSIKLNDKHHQKQQKQQKQQQKITLKSQTNDHQSMLSLVNNVTNTNSNTGTNNSSIMGIPSGITSSPSPIAGITTTLESHQIQIHQLNENSPSPELFLDRVLSSESMHYNIGSFDSNNGMNSINDINGINNINGINGMNGINGINGIRGINGINDISGMIDGNISSSDSSNVSGDDHHLNAISSSSSTVIKKPLNLDGPLKHQIDTIDYLHHSSPSPNPTTISGRGLDQLMLHETKEPIPNELKCRICGQIYKDPRTLNCLHSFCFQCLINENFIKDISIPFWSRPNHHNNFDWTSMSDGINNDAKSLSANNSFLSSSINDSDCLSTPGNISSRQESRSSITSFISKKSSDKLSKDKSSKSSPKKQSLTTQQQQQQNTATIEKVAIIVCTICKFYTEIPIGGIRQLPQNFILTHKIENLLLKIGNEIISNIWCSLCCAEITAAYHCITCTINLCSFCKQAHERQKSTSNHNIKHLLELRKSRMKSNSQVDDQIKQSGSIKCSLHPGFDLKAFCITCQQIICSDCTVLLHKGHKCELAHKAFKTFQKSVKDTVDKTKPLCEYAEHSISKLNSISMKINKKCDEIQNDVEQFTTSYLEAIEIHRKTLLNQIARARETKIQIILEQQFEMEKKASEAKDAVVFGEELLEYGNEIEILSFVNILLKRLDYCQKFKPLLNPKISDTLHFLPQVRATAISAQNNIPLYGIITTQTVEPQYCTLETEGYTQLRVHKRVELVILSRDTDNVPLCHGGLTINTQLKYKDSSKLIDAQVSDRRDGTYMISFVPDSPGTMTLVVTIDNKHIKGSPFTLIARTVKPHRGIFHCCTFCSSKGSKTVSCACEGTMPGFKGCGHGHTGHPGRRHWSCCGSILENSECTVTNQF